MVSTSAGRGIDVCCTTGPSAEASRQSRKVLQRTFAGDALLFAGASRLIIAVRRGLVNRFLSQCQRQRQQLQQVNSNCMLAPDLLPA